MGHEADQLQQLIKMANHIAANQPADIVGEESAAAAVAEHIQKFWAPPMRQKICDHLAQGGGELTPLARRALESL